VSLKKLEAIKVIQHEFPGLARLGRSLQASRKIPHQHAPVAEFRERGRSWTGAASRLATQGFSPQCNQEVYAHRKHPVATARNQGG